MYLEKRNKREKPFLKWFICVLCALFISFGCYVINNIPYPFFDDLNTFSALEYLIRNVGEDNHTYDDAFFINVGYDKDTADYEYADGMLKGHVAVTNRDSLVSFLKIAERTNTYKYIFLDVRFDKGISTDADSMLFSQIKRMRNLCFSRHSGEELQDSSVLSRSFPNDYFHTITSTNFTRYQFLQDDVPSVPLGIHSTLDPDHKTISRYGPLYFYGNELCQNCSFLNIFEDFYKGYDVIGEQGVFDLGPYLLKYKNDESWAEMLKDKIVFLGDFIEDVHDTYAGKQPGTFLIYLAYRALKEGGHLVSWWFVGFMFLVYVLIMYSLLSRQPFWEYISVIHNTKSKILRFIISLLGYTTILSLITWVMYLFFGVTNNIYLPALFFSIVNLLKQYNKV